MENKSPTGEDETRREECLPPAGPSQSRSLLEAALASVADGVAIVDAEGRQVFLNEVGRQLLRCAPAPEESFAATAPACRWRDLAGQPLSPDETPPRRALRGETVRDCRLVCQGDDGSATCFSVTASPVLDDHGRIVGAVSVFRDVSEQRQAEEALSAAASISRAIFDAANDAIFVHDPQTGQILDVNEKMRELYGYSPEEARRLSVQDMSAGVPPYTQEEALRWVEAAARGEPQLFEWLAKDRAGRLFWVEVNLKRAVIGGAERLLAIVRDIGERKRAEAERERLLAELEATIASIPDAVLVFGPRGEILRLNPAAEAMLGYSPADWQKPLSERVAALRLEKPDGAPFPPEELISLRALRGETACGQLGVLHRPSDGRVFWVSASAAPIRRADGGILGAVLTLADVTAVHELEQRREEFVHSISHDLRSPLTVMLGMAQWLQGRLAQLGLAHEAASAGRIATSGERMNSMIRDLVESARLEAGPLELHRQPANLVEVVSDILGRVGTKEERLRLGMEAPQPVSPVPVDRERMERALVNLITNALKYSPSGRPVTVRVAEGAGEAIVSVVDRGIGIPADEQPFLFQRYYRARTGKQTEGLGLGLYIARLIVEAHGGRIWCESEPGIGSTFSVALPLA